MWPPYRFLPFCAKTACRLMKRYDFFEYNYIGHHLKQVLVDNSLGCCHQRFCPGVLVQNFQFFLWSCLAPEVFILISFFSLNSKSAPQN